MPDHLPTPSCPCGSSRPYDHCCGLYHSGRSFAETAEKLMRSRYTAFVLRNGDYLAATLAKENRRGFDGDSIGRDQTHWTGLEIIDRVAGGIFDQTGIVEFIASFVENGQTYQLHERSNFERRDGKWFYVDGIFPGDTKQHSEGASLQEGKTTLEKVGRNAPCPCGSGKKFKKCCG